MSVVQAHSDVTKTTEVLRKSEKHDPKRYRNKIYSWGSSLYTQLIITQALHAPEGLSPFLCPFHPYFLHKWIMPPFHDQLTPVVGAHQREKFSA